MIDGDETTYSFATFIGALFLLELGADRFVDYTAIVTRQTEFPDTIIALLTASAQWEELVVIISSLVLGRPSLAVGNIVGSAISNILGAFALGLLSYQKGNLVHFDRSSRIYSLLLLVVTSFITPITYFPHRTIWLVCGIIMITFFAVYTASITWATSKGSLTALEDTDDDSSTASARTSINGQRRENQETDPLMQNRSNSAHIPGPQKDRRGRHSVRHHVSYLGFGFLAICLAGYILSHTAINIMGAIGISDVLFGVIILAIATSLPKKFVAVMSGHRGHIGILVANTVGSNVFLLSLCLGIIMVDTSEGLDSGNVSMFELAVLWGSTLVFTSIVWFGSRFAWWTGATMLAGYIAFIILEFTVMNKITETP